MTILPIIHAPDIRLRTKCTEISEITDDLRKLLDDMLQTMYDAPGVGLAAPQVGETIRAFVMDCEQTEDEDGVKPGRPLKLINPKIIWKSEELRDYEEGCLSLPYIQFSLQRAAEVEVEYLDENGQKQTLKADGLTATCIQHELDHLDGITLLEHMGSVRRQLNTQKLRKLKAASKS